MPYRATAAPTPAATMACARPSTRPRTSGGAGGCCARSACRRRWWRCSRRASRTRRTRSRRGRSRPDRLGAARRIGDHRGHRVGQDHPETLQRPCDGGGPRVELVALLVGDRAESTMMVDRSARPQRAASRASGRSPVGLPGNTRSALSAPAIGSCGGDQLVVTRGLRSGRQPAIRSAVALTMPPPARRPTRRCDGAGSPLSRRPRRRGQGIGVGPRLRAGRWCRSPSTRSTAGRPSSVWTRVAC